MCEVCAVFGRGGHWTARASGAGDVFEAIDLRWYRVERQQALRLVNALLISKGLRAEDWDGESYQVIAKSGAAIKAANLADIWAVSSRLAGADVDPLAADFLESEP